MRKTYLYQLMKAYKEECGIKHAIVWSYKNHILTICTDRVGPMIGLRGQTVTKYINLIRDNMDSKFETIEFIETDGIV